MSTLQVGTISEKVTDAGVAVDGVTLKDGDVTIADKIIHDGDTNTAIRFPSADTVTIETGGSEVFRVDANGHITKPLQPAFLVRPSSQQADIQNAETIAFGTETFDQNGDFSSNTFTAPVTGRYQFNVNMRVDNLAVSGNYSRIELVTSNTTYVTTMLDATNAFSASPGEFAMHGIVLADMDANDTAFLRWSQSGGGSTADIETDSMFSGFLAC